MKIAERYKEIESDWKALLVWVEKVGNLDEKMRRAAIEDSVKMLKLLRPYSDLLTRIPIGSETYTICRKIRIAYSGQPIGSAIGREKLFQIVKNHGELFVPHVSSNRRREFEEIVKIVKAMNTEAELSVPFQGELLVGTGGPGMISYMANGLRVKSREPSRVYLGKCHKVPAGARPSYAYYGESEDYVDLSSFDSIASIEALLPSLQKAHKTLLADLEAKAAENKALVKRSEEILGRLVLASVI